jgi:hypothetical protein
MKSKVKSGAGAAASNGPKSNSAGGSQTLLGFVEQEEKVD